jgi:hypothetical protein
MIRATNPTGRPRVCRWASVLLAVCMILGLSTRDGQALPKVQRYVSLTATPNPLDLGTLTGVGVHTFEALLAMRLTSNCAHGGVVMVAQPLRTEGGAEIPLSALFVQLPGSSEYLPLSVPVALTAPAGPGVLDFQVGFRAVADHTIAPGSYVGTLHLVTEGIAGGGPAVPGPVVEVHLNVDLHAMMFHMRTRSYVHLGNPYQASEEDLTLRATTVLSANTGMLVGLNLAQMGQLSAASVELDSGNRPTGRVLGSLQGTRDVLGRDISDESFDLRVLMSWDGGNTFDRPTHCGQAPDGHVAEAIWWRVGEGVPGLYPLVWQIQLLPTPHQADGTYYFTSEVVIAPEM